MNDQTSNPQPTIVRDSEIESLARETDTPLDTVREIYRVERDKLERSARVKTFVSVLAHRRVKALLQVERGKRH
jgi:N-glycosylase/DNA lyase